MEDKFIRDKAENNKKLWFSEPIDLLRRLGIDFCYIGWRYRFLGIDFWAP
jgi:hypothetical protein